MAASHAQLFANQVLPRAVLSDPLAFTRAIANGDAPRVLAELWQQAGDELAPIYRADGAGMAAILMPRPPGLYVTAMISPPPPRETGDPALIAVVGRGNGVDKLTTVAYYVLELLIDGPGITRFKLVARGEAGRIASWDTAPLPDAVGLADFTFELYSGHEPALPTNVPELPPWYWWQAFDAGSAVKAFEQATDDTQRLEVMRGAPMLLLPEIAGAAESYAGATAAQHLRELQTIARKDPAFDWAWQALVQRLANTNVGSPVANHLRLLPLVQEARLGGALSRAQAYELEGTVRNNLAALGVDPHDNHTLAQELFAAARTAADARPNRPARGTAPPPVSSDEVTWTPLVLENSDLPQHMLAARDEVNPANDPTFAALGGLRAAAVAWVADESSPMAHILDSRWAFRTAAAAAQFLHGAALHDGLRSFPAPQLGDDTLAFGDDGSHGGRRAYVLVIRANRVVARLHVVEGTMATASRQILHPAMLHPLGEKIVHRARKAVAAYWFAVVYPTNAVPALVHSPGYDASRLLSRYPLLAHPELPAALAVLDEKYVPAARALASYHAHLRAHRWSTYRDAMLALVRSLLATDMGDPRVNVAHAHEIVNELRHLDPDPVWAQLDAECRARG